MEYKDLRGLYWLILILPLIILLVNSYNKKKRITRLIDIIFYKKLEILKSILMIIGIFIMILALTGPRKFSKKEPVDVKGIDIMILIDTSRSMLATDIKPNRLSRVKYRLNDLIGKLKGDRVGLIPFTGEAFVQMPLTDDYNVAKMFIDVIDTDIIDGSFANFTNVIQLANNHLKSTDGNKVVLIISDGETKEQLPENIFLEDVSYFSVGIGTKSGSFIPLKIKGRESGYLKDDQGKPIRTKLSSEILKEIAKKSNGSYYEDYLNDDWVDEFLSDIDYLADKERQSREINIYKEFFQIPILIGLIIFMLGYFFDKLKGLTVEITKKRKK